MMTFCISFTVYTTTTAIFQYNSNREAAKILALSSGKSDK